MHRVIVLARVNTIARLRMSKWSVLKAFSLLISLLIIALVGMRALAQDQEPLPTDRQPNISTLCQNALGGGKGLAAAQAEFAQRSNFDLTCLAQLSMVKLGYLSADQTVDGFLGMETGQALEAFQADYGLPAFGLVTVETLEVLEELEREYEASKRAAAANARSFAQSASSPLPPISPVQSPRSRCNSEHDPLLADPSQSIEAGKLDTNLQGGCHRHSQWRLNNFKVDVDLLAFSGRETPKDVMVLIRGGLTNQTMGEQIVGAAERAASQGQDLLILRPSLYAVDLSAGPACDMFNAGISAALLGLNIHPTSVELARFGTLELLGIDPESVGNVVAIFVTPDAETGFASDELSQIGALNAPIFELDEAVLPDQLCRYMDGIKAGLGESRVFANFDPDPTSAISQQVLAILRGPDMAPPSSSSLSSSSSLLPSSALPTPSFLESNADQAGDNAPLTFTEADDALDALLALTTTSPASASLASRRGEVLPPTPQRAIGTLGPYQPVPVSDAAEGLAQGHNRRRVTPDGEFMTLPMAGGDAAMGVSGTGSNGAEEAEGEGSERPKIQSAKALLAPLLDTAHPVFGLEARFQGDVLPEGLLLPGYRVDARRTGGYVALPDILPYEFDENGDPFVWDVVGGYAYRFIPEGRGFAQPSNQFQSASSTAAAATPAQPLGTFQHPTAPQPASGFGAGTAQCARTFVTDSGTIICLSQNAQIGGN